MTRKDYIILAQALKERKPKKSWVNKYVQWTQDVWAIKCALAKDNPLFVPTKFLDACGYEAP